MKRRRVVTAGPDPWLRGWTAFQTGEALEDVLNRARRRKDRADDIPMIEQGYQDAAEEAAEEEQTKAIHEDRQHLRRRLCRVSQ